MTAARSAPAGAIVEFRDVTKRYGGGAEAAGAVNHLSLTVPAGEICVLVGPSGCGKTTTLRMVNRLVEPTSGQILIDGTDVMSSEPTQLRRRIGYVIQQIGLFPHQTIAQNVATVPSLLGWDRARSRDRVDELLNLVGLDPARYRGRYPLELSGGERQRVGVARALAAEPPVMLMDEPFGAVDPIVREHLQDEFLRLHRTLGMTVLLVTHDIDEAIKLGTRVAVMGQGGHLEQYATPFELLSRPATDFVAQFVGADRALKQLALMRLSDVIPVPLDSLSWDGRGRSEDLPRFGMAMLLRDVLSNLLTLDVRGGIIHDEAGRDVGAVTLESIGAALKAQSKPGDHASETSGGAIHDAR
ncbi:MAG: ABC transporter ATP-binding protein [Chloroflexota bacterium]